MRIIFLNALFLIQLSYVIMLFKNFMSYLLDVNLNKVDHGGDETKGSFAARYDIIVSSISFVQDLNFGKIFFNYQYLIKS